MACENGVNRLMINSDSKYVVMGITQWILKWTKDNWKNASGELVKNKDEWVALLSLIESSEIDITWNHVPGHQGIAGDEEADKLALKGAGACGNEERVAEHTSKLIQPTVLVISKSSNQNSEVTNSQEQLQEKILPQMKSP